MGMNAELLAIGPYSKDIVNYLEYPPKFYGNVPEGTQIITCAVYCATTSQSHELAEACNTHCWSLWDHVIDGDTIGTDYLRNIVSDEEVDAIIALTAAGFKFYYRPNG